MKSPHKHTAMAKTSPSTRSKQTAPSGVSPHAKTKQTHSEKTAPAWAMLKWNPWKHDWYSTIAKTLCVLGVVWLVTEVISFFIDLQPEKYWYLIFPIITLATVVGVFINEVVPGNLVVDFEDAVDQVPPVTVFISYDRSDPSIEVTYTKGFKKKLLEKASGSKLTFLVSPEDTPDEHHFQSITAPKMKDADLIVAFVTHKYYHGVATSREFNFAQHLAGRGKELICISHDVDIEELQTDRLSKMAVYREDQKYIHDSQRKLKAIEEEKRGKLKACIHGIYKSAPGAVKDLISTLGPWVPRTRDSYSRHDEADEPKDTTPKGFHRVDTSDEVTPTSSILTNMIQDLARKHPEKTKPLQFDRITRFWKTKPHLLEYGQIVRITGTVSTYAPVIVGPPMMKRDAHLNFRISKGAIKESSLNTFLAFSAGQMVWALAHPTKEQQDRHMCRLGLYQGIVRNSIPMYLNPKYYDRVVAPMFTDTSKSKTFEGTVTARVFRFPEYSSALSLMEGWASGRKSDKRKPIWKEDMPVYGLVVGYDNDTGIEKVGEATYLDGDIWVVVEKEDGEDEMVARFGDLSNEKDVKKMIGQMRDEVGSSQVIFQFDQVDKPFGESKYTEPDFARPFLSTSDAD